jgi:hypothetical protein
MHHVTQRAGLALAAVLVAGTWTIAVGQDSMSDADIIKTAMSAAPSDVSDEATIVDPTADGKMRTVREGSNGWVCMARPEMMCLDQAWQGWAEAWMGKTDPPKPKGIGVAYMLKGDTGASNTDPFATGKSADNQWVVTGPHLMILAPNPSDLDALPTDPYSGGPFVMWKGTPYAHIMIPTVPMK